METNYADMSKQELIAKLEAFENVVTQLENTIEALDSEREMLTNKLRQSLHTVPAVVETTPHLEHEAVINDLNTALDKNDELEKQVEDLNEKLAAAEFFQDYQKGELNSLMGEVATLQDALEEAHEELLHMTDDRDGFYDRCMGLVNDISTLSDEIHALKKEIERHKGIEDVLINVCKEAQDKLDK